MNIDTANIIGMIITSGVMGILSVSWNTYNKFVVMISKVEYIIERLENYERKHDEIFDRLKGIENRLTKLEK